MPQNTPPLSWIVRARLMLGEWLRRLGLRPAGSGPAQTAPEPPAPPADAPYPDYITCPYCGEPEVEVWCSEETARCHNCGRTFKHRPPPDGDSDSPPQ